MLEETGLDQCEQQLSRMIGDLRQMITEANESGRSLLDEDLQVRWSFP